jgi:hypothetical protein
MDVDDARCIRRNQLHIHGKSTEVMLRRVQKQVSVAASLGEDDLLTRIPPFLVDLPSYDPVHVAMELVSHFRRKGFYCKNLGSILYLSWR